MSKRLLMSLFLLSLPLFAADTPAPTAPAGFVYAEMGSFSDGLCAVSTVQTWGEDDEEELIGNWGFIDKSGKEVIAPHFAGVGWFHDGLATVGVAKADVAKDAAGKVLSGPKTVEWGIIDRKGNWVVKPQFAELHAPVKGLAVAAIIDTEGEKKDPAKPEAPGADYPKLLWGLIDMKGNWVIKPAYSRFWMTEEGVIRAGVPKPKTEKKRPKSGDRDEEEWDPTLWGLMDLKGKWILKPEYDKMKTLADGFVQLTRAGKNGLIDKKGNLLGGQMFDEVGAVSDGAAGYRIGEKWGFINAKGGFISAPRFAEIEDFHEGLAPVRINYRWGFLNKAGKVEIPVRYGRAGIFCEAIAFVAEEYGAWSAIDATGQEVFALPAHCWPIRNFSHGLAVVRSDDKISVIDRTGRFITSVETGVETYRDRRDRTVEMPSGALLLRVPVATAPVFINQSGTALATDKFEGARDFSEGMAAVVMKDGWAYIDKEGHTVIPSPAKLGERDSFHEGLACAHLDGKCGYIDKKGNPAFAARFRSVTPFSGGLAAVADPARGGGLWGYIDKEGQYLIEPRFNYGGPFHDGVAPVLDGALYGYIDRTGKFVVEPSLDAAGPFSESLAPVREKGKWGYVDTTGKTVIECQYEDSGPFAEGLASVKVSGKWGFIDRTGKMVVKPQFTYAPGGSKRPGEFATYLEAEAYARAPVFSEGLAAVELDYRSGFIDHTGKFAIQPRFNSARNFHSGRAVVTLGRRACYIDTVGKPVPQTGCAEGGDFCDGLALVRTPAMAIVVFPDGGVVELPSFFGTWGEKEEVVETSEGMGYMDEKGKWLISPRFENARGFADGVAAVRTGDKWGYIHSTGNFVIPARFDYVRDFKDGVAVVGMKCGAKGDIRWGLINKTGKLLTLPAGK